MKDIEGLSRVIEEMKARKDSIGKTVNMQARLLAEQKARNAARRNARRSGGKSVAVVRRRRGSGS